MENAEKAQPRDHQPKAPVGDQNLLEDNEEIECINKSTH